MSDVILSREGGVGRITLNRPKALNALTLEMVEIVEGALSDWQDDPGVDLVLLNGAGERGLCAGGDIRALYDAALADDLSFPKAFFHAEYRLNARIARYPKPYVAFMDGIVMGGGIGVSAHGSHRVVTEKTRWAMPETGIGFLPEVGGTWLLGCVPDQLGVHAALTAAQMGAADAIVCGLADVHVESAKFVDLADGLKSCKSAQAVGACLDAFATPPAPGVLDDARGWIAECYSGDSVEGILDALRARGLPMAQKAVADMGGKSPTSLKITLRALREAVGLGRLEPCLEQEYRLALACMSSHDFREGVRAAVVDKDRNPAWSPVLLRDVSPAMVEAFFAAPNYGGLGLV